MELTSEQLKQINEELARMVNVSRAAGLFDGSNLQVSEPLVQALIAKAFVSVFGESDQLHDAIRILGNSGCSYDHPVELYNIAVIVDDVVNLMGIAQQRNSDGDQDELEDRRDYADLIEHEDDNEVQDIVANEEDARDDCDDKAESEDDARLDDEEAEEREIERRIIESILGEGRSDTDTDVDDDDDLVDLESDEEERQGSVDAVTPNPQIERLPRHEEKARPTFTTRRQSFTDNDL